MQQIHTLDFISAEPNCCKKCHFLKNVKPLPTSTSESRVWESIFREERIPSLSPVALLALNRYKKLPVTAESMWTEWKFLNRSRTGIEDARGMIFRQGHKWGYLSDNQDLNCLCGTEPHTMQHLLQCDLLAQVCTAQDLTTSMMLHRNVFSSVWTVFMGLGCGFGRRG